MAVQRPESPGGNGTPIPRDLPDQQADGGEDPWDIGDPEQAADAGGSSGSGEAGESGEDGESAPDVPDTDEAGTGRQGAAQAGRGQSDHPVPDEPSA
ncbi:hypothetical protein [Streptomyces maremycinicus]|uniref:hypothetical protein n=1 Tax=Streptomyces maremycinicus TaxID=1679753 RepID=UPI0007899EAE|nr:hypothetical protein [Streptomyces sp. NBRC 110468]